MRRQCIYLLLERVPEQAISERLNNPASSTSWKLKLYLLNRERANNVL